MSDDFKSRFDLAKKAKDLVLSELNEVYHYCLDGRADDPKANKRDEDTFSSVQAEAAEDFAADLVTYFMPEHAPWIKFEAGANIDEEFKDEANEIAVSRQKLILQEIASSNLYSTVNTAFLDAAHGTIAIWVHDAGDNQPIICEPIHVAELYLNVGPYGLVDDRFRKRRVSWSYIIREYPQAKETKAYRDLAKRDGIKSKFADIVEGFWRDWSDDGKGIKWKSEVQVDGEEVFTSTLEDFSEVPLCIGRFRPSPSLPWGKGPGRRLLPEFRVHNEIADMSMQNIERALDPPMWTNDATGDFDFSNGIEAGKVYPLVSGSVIEPINMGGNLDTSIFAVDQYEERIRRGFYQDGPRQRGQTPPTATQWLDEVRRIQQRLGRPAAPIYSEFVVHVVKRFYGILVKHKIIPDGTKIDGKLLTVKPINPLTFAQRQDEVMTSRALMADIAQFDPQGFSMLVDTSDTFRSIQSTIGDTLVKIRNSDEIAQLREQEAALLAAQQQGAIQ